MFVLFKKSLSFEILFVCCVTISQYSLIHLTPSFRLWISINTRKGTQKVSPPELEGSITIPEIADNNHSQTL